jgi:competence protein ComEC
MIGGAAIFGQVLGVRALASSWFGDVLAAERDRWLLWLPVAFGAGIGLYFILPEEPPLWLGIAVAVGAVVAAMLGRSHAGILVTAVALVAIGTGFAAAQWRATLVAAPVLEQRWGPARLDGRVVAVEIRAEGRRVILDRVEMAGLAQARTPAQVRVNLRGRAMEANLKPGERVSLRAVLMPPPGPAAPGAYDFQRQAWFDRLGAVGFAVTPPKAIEGAPSPAGWRLQINALRQAVVERTLEAIPGPAGAIAAALLTGEMGAIPPDVMAAMRDSGLAHLLSISGLHIGLVASIVFVILRQILALIPRVALAYPIKKWAAVAAFLAITFYTLFATPGVPTQRSWLMTSVVLFAILIDRTAITMRLVAWAAFAVLALLPESLLGPSFQMSFAAVVALIAAWEVLRQRFADWRAGGGVVRRAAVSLVAVGMTTLVAGFASAPYALYHFNRFAAFGLVANLIAVPLTGIWVMPLAVAAALLWPFGLQDWALVPMGWGVEIIIAVAQMVAGWGGAVALLPAMPVWGLVAVTLGGLWLCLWRTRWRLAGVPVIALGLLSIALTRGPDVLVSGDGKLVAVRGADGLLQLSSDRAAPLTRESWLRRAGQEDVTLWPSEGASLDGQLVCDPAGCLYRVRGQVVALVRDTAALAEDCGAARVVVAIVPVRRKCAGALVVDRFSLWRDGGHALWLERDGVVIDSVRQSRGVRPWVPKPPEPRARRVPEQDRFEPHSSTSSG